MKNIIIIRSLIILCLFFSSNLIAQENSVVKMELTEENNKTHERTSQAIKINPLLFFRGDIPIYYEKNIIDNLSVEVGAGITLTDFFSSLSVNSDVFLGNDNNIETKLKMGYSYRVGLKYYAADYNYQPEGIYFGLHFRQQTFNSTLLNVNSIQANNEELKRVNNDVILSFGYVHLFEENAFIEPYAGLGVRNRKYKDVSRIDGMNSGIATSYLIESKEDILPLLSLGIKIGINF